VHLFVKKLTETKRGRYTQLLLEANITP